MIWQGVQWLQNDVFIGLTSVCDRWQTQILRKTTWNWIVDLLASKCEQTAYNLHFDRLFDAMIMNASFHYLNKGHFESINYLYFKIRF